MDRRDFLRYGSLAGVGLGLMPTLLQSCKRDDRLTVNFDGKVVIIGAGAAGMMAAYTLQQYDIDFVLIEAASSFGGRVKKTDTFADFPIDIGAEWLHDNPNTFSKLIADDNVQGSIDMISYQPESIYFWNGNSLTQTNFGSHFYREYKFKRTTWFDFFEDFIVPSISSKIVYNEIVDDINYSGNTVEIQTTGGNTYTGDKVIVTVPMTILQEGSINFTPTLSSDIQQTIDGIEVPPGLKVFMQFNERFYPDLLGIGSALSGSDAEKLYYDAAFKKDSSQNVLGLFQVGPEASQLTNLSNADIISTILAQLDEIFDGKASQNYVSHIIQNWSTEPHIKGSYTFLKSSDYAKTERMSEGVNNKLYFAGEAFHQSANSTVHGAGFTGRDIASKIITGG